MIVKRLQVICNICYIPLSSLQGLSFRIDRAEKHEGIKYYELSNDKKQFKLGLFTALIGNLYGWEW